jgi:hypothetical protein
MIKKTAQLFGLQGLGVALFSTQAFAQEGFKFTLSNPGFTNLGPLIEILMSLVFAAAGLFFFAQLFIAGFAMINAGGDPKAMTAARSRITNAIVGLVVVIGAYAIIKIVEAALGISILSGIDISGN